jgi:FkbM family methyltransferase
MRRVYGSLLPLLLLPFIGGTLGKLPGLSILRRYWSTLPWITDIFGYGAAISWKGDDVTVKYAGLSLCASAIDESLYFLFFETHEVDEYGIGARRFDNMTILDVGANIGDTAVLFMSKGAAKVISFEPIPSVYRYLNKTIKENGFDSTVETHCVGLSDKDEFVDVWVREMASAGSSTILHSRNVLGNNPYYSKENIKLVNCEKYLADNNITKVDVIKMDCEHCEYTLFRNGKLLDILNPSLIYLEYHAGPKALVKLFNRCGYDVDISEKNQRVGVIKAIKMTATKNL